MNRWRLERRNQDQPGLSFIIADGTTRWSVDPAEKTYRRSPAERMAQWEIQHLEIPNQLAGIGPTNFDSLEDLVAFVSNITAEVSHRGQDTLRGVQTHVLEYQGRELPGAPRMSGVMWIDTSGRKMVVLRHVEAIEENGRVSRVVAEVAAVEYGASFDPSLSEFDPAGYTEVR